MSSPVVHIEKIEYHTHNHVDMGEVIGKLNHIINHQHEIMSAVDDLKAKIASQDAALDTVSTNVTGIAGDVAFLKQKLADLEGGATAAEIAELTGSVDSISTKIDAIGTATASLDAETDPNA